MAVTPLTQQFAVLAGPPRAGRSAVLDALLDEPGLAPELPTSAWLVYRHGDRPDARAFVPGNREPRPMEAEVLRGGDPALAGKGGPGRPPRRIEVTHPAELLAELALVDAPGVGELDAALAELLLDAAERATGLVWVQDAATPPTKAELDLLDAVAALGRHLVVVLTGPGARQHAADAGWLAVDPATGEGVAELHQLLREWAAEPAPEVIENVTATTVSSDQTGWEAVLDREIRNRRVAAVQRASIDLATVHVRCVQELGTGKGIPEMPYVLDRSLHALSTALTRQLANDTAVVVERVFGVLLDAPPNAAVLRRITGSARAAVDGLERERDRAMLLTTTSAVAVLTGRGAAGGLAALGLPEPADEVLPAIGIGLTGSCYQMWQPRVMPDGPPRMPEKKDCRRWLQHALRVIEAELERELAERYDDLRQALSVIAADAVDHGVLLA